MPSWLNAEVVVPENDAPNRQFFEEQGKGEGLRLPHCQDCDMLHYPVRTLCPDCRSTNIDYRTVSGKGTVHSYFILSEPIHPAYHPHPDTPIALIELDEQRGVGGGGDRTVQPNEFRALRLVGNIVKADGSFEDPDDVAVNKRVQVHMVDLGDGWGLPQWELSGEPSEGAEWQVPNK
jgi:uncharacterized OB-fold protein